jgi:ADP-heptose:LPS heptosyltransferase
MANTAFSVLFLAPPARADAIFASGLLKRLREEIEQPAFTVVASEDSAPLFREVPDLENLIVSERRRFGDAFGLWRRLRSRSWGLALDARGGGLLDLLKTKRKARPKAAPAPAEPEHKVVKYARLLKIEQDPPAPHIFVSEETKARAEELVPPDGPVLAMAPAAPWVGAAWPIERFARTAVQLLGEDGPLARGRLVIIGDPDRGRQESETLRRALPRGSCIDLTQEADPLVLCACLQRARLFVGGAVWRTHLAAAAGAPTLGLFGPTDEVLEGVWGEHTRVVRGPRSFEAIRAADPRLDQSLCHMMDLPVDAALEAAVQLINQMATTEKKRRHG